MHKTFAAFRAIAALALVLALVAGLFSPRGISAQGDEALPSGEPDITLPVEPTDPATEVPTEVATEAPTEVPTEVATEVPTVEPVVTTEPEVIVPGAVDGDAGEDSGTDTDDVIDVPANIQVAEDALEFRARAQISIGETGVTIFEQTAGDVGLAQIGDSAPLDGGTFEVRTSADNELIDATTTGPTGNVQFDLPLNQEFVIVDVDTGTESQDFFVDEISVQNGLAVITATRLISQDDNDDDGTIPDNDGLFPIAVDQIEVRVRTIEVPGGLSGIAIVFGAGTFEEIDANQIIDNQPAPLTIRVRTTATDQIIDTATAGPDGILLLDAPIDEEFVVEVVGTSTISEPITLDFEDPTLGRTLLTAIQTIAVTPGSNTGPTGDILPFPVAYDQVELRARFEETPIGDGLAIYVSSDEGGIEDAAIGESIEAPGVTFTVLAGGLVVDQATTDGDGTVLLDIPAVDITGGGEGAFSTYTIINDYNGQSSQPFSAYLADGVSPETADRTVITATLGVADLDDVAPQSPSPSTSPSGGPSDIGIPSTPASASPSASASASPSVSPSPSVPVIENAVTITGQISENADRAGEYDYFYNFVESDDEGDVRFVGAGEHFYFVVYFDGNDLFVADSGPTDETGMVTLDAPVGFPYFIFEDDDFNDPYGSQDVPADTSANFLVIEYVTDITASPSASASGVASGSAHPSSSDDDGSAHPSGSAKPSAAAASSAAAAASGTGGATALPNTGAGDSGSNSSMTWALFALLAVVGVAAAGFGLRRRTV